MRITNKTRNGQRLCPLAGSGFYVILMVAALLAFALVYFNIAGGAAVDFDNAVRTFFYNLRGPVLTPIAISITHVGDTASTVALCIVLLLLPMTRYPYGVTVSAGALCVSLINTTIKHIVMRPRPSDISHLVQEGGFSFPSGHSITSMFVYGILVYLIRTTVQNKRLANILTVILALPMFLIGPSRVYVGVHYPTDVLGGWCLGAAAICAAVLIIRLVRSKRKGECL